MYFSPVVFSASSVDELRQPKLPRVAVLRLGKTICPSLDRFRQGKLFPHHDVQRTDASFKVFTCGSCENQHFSRAQYEVHLKEAHPDVMESNKYCESCMKCVPDMRKHLVMHQQAQAALLSLGNIFPAPLFSCFD